MKIIIFSFTLFHLIGLINVSAQYNNSSLDDVIRLTKIKTILNPVSNYLTRPNSFKNDSSLYKTNLGKYKKDQAEYKKDTTSCDKDSITSINDLAASNKYKKTKKQNDTMLVAKLATYKKDSMTYENDLKKAKIDLAAVNVDYVAYQTSLSTYQSDVTKYYAPLIDSVALFLYRKNKKTPSVDSSNPQSNFGDNHRNTGGTQQGEIGQPSGSGNNNHHGPFPIDEEHMITEEVTPESVMPGTQVIPPNDFKAEVRQYVALIYGKSYVEVMAINGNNPFTNFLYAESIVTNNTTNFTGGPLPASLVFSQANIIYGVTDFFLSRAKEEMVEAYLQKLYDTLNKIYIIKTFLPNSLGTIKSFIDNNSLALAKYGNLFKASFEKDMKNIPNVIENEDTVKSLLNIIDPKLNANDKTQISSAISGMTTIGNGLYEKEQLPDIIDLLASRYELKANANITVFNKIILFSDVATKNLVSVSYGGSNRVFTFTDPRAILDLSTDQINFWINIIEVRNDLMLLKTDANCITAIDEERPEFLQYLVEVSNIFTSLKEILKSSSNITALNSEDISKILDNCISIISNSMSFLQKANGTVLSTSNPTIPDWYNKSLLCFNSVSEIHEGVISKHYGDVLHGTISMLKIFAPQDSRTIDYLTRYGSFLVNILMAKNDSDVTAALDELVPKDSYKVKYSTKFSVSVSGYPGINGGLEQLYSPNGNHVNPMGITFGPSLPVGIDIDWGTGKGWSLGLFAQVVDLGAVMNYRLTNNDSSAGTPSANPNPQISFKQILSPGVSFLVRPPYSPITIGVGTEYTPELRGIQMGNVATQASSLRFQITLGVDVTALVLTSKN